MELKSVLKSLDGIPEALKDAYKKDGDDYRLQVEGMVPKDKYEEFREANKGLHQKVTELTDKLKTYDGVDLKQIAEMRETERKVKDGELIKAGKFDELFASKIDPIIKSHKDALEAKDRDNAAMKSQLTKVMIDQELTKLATAKGLRPEAITDMLGRLRSDFTVVGDKVVALDEAGSQRRTDTGETYTLEKGIETLHKSAPHLFQSSNGSGAQQNQNTNGNQSGKTITRGEFAKLAPADQAKVAREAKIVDA